jgi:alpha-1,2-mannosyltransferase
LHSLLIWAGMMPARLLGYNPSKVTEFYFLRAVLAVTCAACSTRFYSVIRRTVNARIATFFMMILVISPGMYHAAPAYLPSTFAMYCTMLGLAAFMDRSGGTLRTSQGITWMAIGSVLGWPFAGALVLPFVTEDIFAGWLAGRLDLTFRRLFHGASNGMAVLFIQTVIDSIFYRELVCVPLNIVLYNVFSGGSRGPDIYGVEPWHFYMRNLALNFNIWFFLALAAPAIILVQYYFARTPISWHTLLRSMFNVSPFYLWLAIFTIQPHKEERFMYPAYPALAWNAAFSLHLLLANFGVVKKIGPNLKLMIVAIPMLLAFNVGMLRVVGKFDHFLFFSHPSKTLYSIRCISGLTKHVANQYS